QQLPEGATIAIPDGCQRSLQIGRSTHGYELELRRSAGGRFWHGTRCRVCGIGRTASVRKSEHQPDSLWGELPAREPGSHFARQAVARQFLSSLSWLRRYHAAGVLELLELPFHAGASEPPVCKVLAIRRVLDVVESDGLGRQSCLICSGARVELRKDGGRPDSQSGFLLQLGRAKGKFSLEQSFDTPAFG